MATDPPDSAISLRWALLVYVVIPLVTVLLIAGHQSLHALEGRIENLLQKEIELIAQTLQLPLSRAVERVDQNALDDALESAFRLRRVFGVYLYDRQGNIFAEAGPIEPLPLARDLLSRASRGRQWGEYGYVANQRVFSYFIPLTDAAGQTTGVLQVTRRASDFRDYIAELRWKALEVLLATGLILTALVVLGHYLAIGKPLGRLVSSMKRITAGDRDYRAQVQGPREIGTLSVALNRMLDSIDRAEREIEQRHRVQAELERRLRRAETMASLGRLAAGVAHELGTPLSVIDGKAQRLLRRSQCPASVRQALEDIRLEVRRMEGIVRHLLGFGRNQGDHQRPMRAHRLVEMAAGAVRGLFDEIGTSLELTGPVPGPPVSVNAMRIEQALVNLLKNACQATPGGHVRLTWLTEGDHVAFRVEDDGPGISEELKGRIIEPFFTTKAVGQGSGLGLAVVDSIAEEHGGAIEIGDSSMGGAAFVLRLPRPQNHDVSHCDEE